MMKRPGIITAVCIVLGLVFLLNCVSIFGAYGETSPGRFAWIVVSSLIAVASIVGLWLMQIWGPLLYLGGQAVGIVAWLLFPMEGAESAYPVWALLVAPAIYAACVLPFWRQFAPLQLRES